MHCNGFTAEGDEMDDQFVFRQGRSRETSYARDYDNLFELLRHEREHGNIVWVMGPAFSFDYDARAAMQALVENGYAHGLMAGNARRPTIRRARCYTRRWARTSTPRSLSRTATTTTWT